MLSLPQPVREILIALNTAGFAAYAVGGCIRDALLGRPVHDWDICTAALPGQVAQCFPGERLLPTGLRHGTLTLLRDGTPYEITTFRREGRYSDGRRPDSVVFVADLHADLARRDFTVNAMAADARGFVTDPFGGQADLAHGLLRCVGEPSQRLNEDALRILRALRFAAIYNFAVEPATASALLALRENLALVSAERILQELRRLLCGPAAGQVLDEFFPVLRVVLPELPPQDESTRGAAFALCPAEELPRFTLLLASLTPAAANAALRRLRAENTLRLGVVQRLTLLREPLPRTRAEVHTQALRYGPLPLRDVFVVRAALGEDAAPAAAILKELVDSNACFDVHGLAFSGEDLLALGLAGPDVGRAQRTLLAAVAGGCPNTKPALRRELEKVFSKRLQTPDTVL